MNERQTWEQAGTTGPEGDGQTIAGDALLAGVDQGGEAGQVSGETVEESLEAVVERVLSAKLGGLRQDLTGEIERRVQSFSDKTANRLSEQQRARLRTLDELMNGLQDHLGPDFDAVKRQKQLDILLDDSTPQGAQSPQGEPQRAQQTAGGDGFADAYLSQKLGDPSLYSAEEQAAIRTALSSARDWTQWMAQVDKYAQQHAGRQAGNGAQTQPGGQQAGLSRAARAQPVQTGRPTSGPMTPEQLQAAYNRAAANGDMAELTRVGALIDKLVST